MNTDCKYCNPNPHECVGVATGFHKWH